jgi:hypothetical protein
VGVLALLLRSETLKRAETETELLVTKQAEKLLKKKADVLEDTVKVKGKYIVELEKKVVLSASGDELADIGNSLFPEPEDDDDSNAVFGGSSPD